jgi:hypothetical protein
MNWTDFAVGAYCGFLVGMVVGGAMIIYQVIWKEKWKPPK